jgi:hypothetical protein
MNPYHISCFEYHDGPSPYNPAPVHDLDHEADSPPNVGDYLHASYEGAVYVVRERFFDIGENGKISRCALIVARTDKKLNFG